MVDRGSDETSTPLRPQCELSVSSHYYPLHSRKVAKGYREFARRPFFEESSGSREFTCEAQLSDWRVPRVGKC